MSQDADSAATDGLLSASRDGAILRLTLDRPSRRNSLNRKMIEEFVATLTEAATDDSLRAIHIPVRATTSAPAPTGLPPTAAATSGPARATSFGAYPTPRTG